MASANRQRVWIGSGARMDKCGVECEVAWLSVWVGSLPSVGSALPSARDLAFGKELKNIFFNSILTCKTQKIIRYELKINIISCIIISNSN